MKIVIDVGQTNYDQAVQVVARRDRPQDPWLFDIVKLPSDQRDDTVTIYSLPIAVLEAISKAATAAKSLQE